MGVNLPPRPPLVRRMPVHFKLYSGCQMPPFEQPRFGFHDLKSKTNFRTKTVLINRLFFKNILGSSNLQNIFQIVSEVTIFPIALILFSALPTSRTSFQIASPYKLPMMWVPYGLQVGCP